MKKRDLRDKVNDHYSIIKACERVGLDMDDYFRARKMHCPFGALYHLDGGDDPAFRVYEDSNHAFCFACNKYFTPSVLIAQYEGLSEDKAVESMLLELGFIESDNDARWEKVQDTEAKVDKAALAQAFQIAAERIIQPWGVRQYDSDVVTWMARCLQPLDRVTTVEQGERWLETVKQALLNRFGKADQ